MKNNPKYVLIAKVEYNTWSGESMYMADTAYIIADNVWNTRVLSQGQLLDLCNSGVMLNCSCINRSNGYRQLLGKNGTKIKNITSNCFDMQRDSGRVTNTFNNAIQASIIGARKNAEIIALINKLGR